MKPLPCKHPSPTGLLAASCISLLLAQPLAWAGPGAHGPNGEHLDAPAAVSASAALPRLETATEAFELLAELRADALVVFVDRFDTNEPVLGAQLEVETGALKAVAAFRPEQGDYAVTDAAMLQALAQPGEHALVFTLMACDDSDLLDGTLVGAVDEASDGHGHGHGHGHDHAGDGIGQGLERAAWTGAGVLALGLLGALVWRRRRSQAAGRLQGGL